MGLLSALKIAANSTFVIGSAVQKTSRNMAHANQETYHRERLNFVSRGNGNGIDIKSLSRETNAFLERELRQQISQAAEYNEVNRIFDFVRQLTGLNKESAYLSEAVKDFEKAWQALQDKPDSELNAKAVIDAAERLTETITELADALNELRGRLENEIHETVGRANKIIREIHRLDINVRRQSALDKPNVVLESERERLLRDLSEIIELQILEGDNNGLTIFLASGPALITQGHAAQLSYDQSAGVVRIDGEKIADQRSVTRLATGTLRAKFNALRSSAEATRDNDGSVGLLNKIEQQLEAFTQLLLENHDSPQREEGSSSEEFEQLLLGDNEAASLNAAFRRFSATDDNPDGTPFFVLAEDTPDDDQGQPLARFGLTVNSAYSGADEQTDIIPIPRELVETTDKRFSILSLLREPTRRLEAEPYALPPLLGQIQVNYFDVAVGILGFLGNEINAFEDLADIENGRRDALRDEISKEFGVNIDEEVQNLQILQNAYSANARVISVVNALLQELINVFR